MYRLFSFKTFEADKVQGCQIQCIPERLIIWTWLHIVISVNIKNLNEHPATCKISHITNRYKKKWAERVLARVISRQCISREPLRWNSIYSFFFQAKGSSKLLPRLLNFGVNDGCSSLCICCWMFWFGAGGNVKCLIYLK